MDLRYGDSLPVTLIGLVIKIKRGKGASQGMEFLSGAVYIRNPGHAVGGLPITAKVAGPCDPASKRLEPKVSEGRSEVRRFLMSPDALAAI